MQTRAQTVAAHSRTPAPCRRARIPFAPPLARCQQFTFLTICRHGTIPAVPDATPGLCVGRAGLPRYYCLASRTTTYYLPLGLHLMGCPAPASTMCPSHSYAACCLPCCDALPSCLFVWWHSSLHFTHTGCLIGTSIGCAVTCCFSMLYAAFMGPLQVANTSQDLNHYSLGCRCCWDVQPPFSMVRGRRDRFLVGGRSCHLAAGISPLGSCRMVHSGVRLDMKERRNCRPFPA